MLRRSLQSSVGASRNVLRRYFCAPAIATTDLPTRNESEPFPDFLTLTVATPDKTVCEDIPARLVTVPGSGGAFGILPGHIPVLCELQPGILSIYHEMSQTSGRQDHYFVSGGFALVHPNSTMEISALHAIDVNDLDPSLVSQNLAEAQSRALAAKEGTAELEAKIEVSVLEKIAHVLTFGAPK